MANQPEQPDQDLEISEFEDVDPPRTGPFAPQSVEFLDTELTKTLFPKLGDKMRHAVFAADFYFNLGLSSLLYSGMILSLFAYLNLSCWQVTAPAWLFIVCGLLAFGRVAWHAFSSSSTCVSARISMHNQVDAVKIYTIIHCLLLVISCIVVIATSPSDECVQGAGTLVECLTWANHSINIITGLCIAPAIIFNLVLLSCYEWTRLIHRMGQRNATFAA